MKKIQTFVAVVDGHRKPSMRRNTYGRYLIGAKSKDEAAAILKSQIGFGSVQIIGTTTETALAYKSAVKECFETAPDKRTKTTHKPVVHATAKQKH